MQRRILVFIMCVLTLGACAQPGKGMYRHDLNDDIIARVAIGQSAQEITTLLSEPYQRIRFDRLKSTAWDYRYRDTWGYWVDFSVMMGDDGRVVNKVSVRMDPVDNK
jgi:hypothetical protein